MLTITQDDEHLIYSRDKVVIQRIKLTDIEDFNVDIVGCVGQILLSVKDGTGCNMVNRCKKMTFPIGEEFDQAIADLILITDGIGI